MDTIQSQWNPPKVARHNMKNDSYRKARGGNAEMYTIYCTNCNTPVLYYQKDGKGQLFRCYLDRIFYPEKYTQLLSKVEKVKDIPPLRCNECATQIGTVMTYKKENRLAYGLFLGKFYKRKAKEH